MFIVNAPFVFYSAWSLIKPMLAERTVKKVGRWRDILVVESGRRVGPEPIPAQRTAEKGIVLDGSCRTLPTVTAAAQ